MKVSAACLIALVVGPAIAAEQTWELRAEFESLRPGDPDVVVLRLPDGRPVEVPLAALSAAGQAAVRREAAAATESGGDKVVTVRGPFGRSVVVPVPESIKLVESDAIHCRTAADAADVYRLAIADERLTGAPRQAAEVRFRDWAAMAEQGLVRLGDRWVPPEAAQAATDEAVKAIQHAFELMRLDNGKQAAMELQKAQRIDPESGQANFVMGLGYALVQKDYAKAAEQFADVVRLEPENAVALNNLAVAEFRIPRYALAIDHFRAAVESATDPRPVLDNITAALKQTAGKGAKVPAKAVADLNSLYRLLIQDMKFKPAEGTTEIRLLGPDNAFCTAASSADIARLCESNHGKAVTKRWALGFVVARGHVVCPRHAVVGRDGAMLGEVAIELPADRGRRLKPAILVAAPADSGVAMLRCDDLAVAPLPLARQERASAEVTVVDRSGDSWLDVRLEPRTGRIADAAPGMQTPGRFFHTAVVPRGLGGAPILDAGGCVVGMVAPTPRTDASGNGAGFGIPVERIRPLVDELPADIRTADEPGADRGGKPAAAVVIVSVPAGIQRPGLDR